MEKQVIFRDRQEMTADDLNNTQGFADVSHQHMVMDAITGERQFVGLIVTKKSATELEISNGRLWDGATGCVYELAQSVVQSVFSLLPLSDEKWLAIAVFGNTEDTHIQPRDFLIDAQTGQTQPDAVSMERRRIVVTHIASGLESPTPQKPEPPTGYTLVAHVRLSSSGVEEIVLNDRAVLPRLDRVAAAVWDIERWRAAISPRVDTLTTDVAGIQAALRDRSKSDVTELAAAVARLQEQMNIPDEYGQYAADYFLNEAESDVAHVEYHARSDEGIRMPWDGMADKALRFMNPFEKAAKVHEGLVLPTYSDVIRLETLNQTGSIPISQYQYQTVEYRRGVMTQNRIRYGSTQTICTNSQQWRTGRYDPLTGIFTNAAGQQWEVDASQRASAARDHTFIRMTQVWIDTITIPYIYPVDSKHQINGAQIAQTFLNAQNGWITGIGLWFSKFDRTAPVTVLITETLLGQPDLNKTVGVANLSATDFDGSTDDVRARFARPLYLEGGKRYAIILISSGDHEVHIVSGADYTQGTLFETVDGAYFQGDNTRDLRMRLYFAHFEAARTVINLEPLDLAGGITDIDIMAQSIVPDGCELHYEYQMSGRWISVADGTADHLLNLPPLLPFRVIFLGTSDLMPGLGLDHSRIRIARPGTRFKHISTQRTLAVPSRIVEVQGLLEGWDEKRHTLDIGLLVGGTRVAPTAVRERNEPSGVRRIARFELSEAISDYVIEFIGTTTTPRQCFHVAQRIDMGL